MVEGFKNFNKIVHYSEDNNYSCTNKNILDLILQLQLKPVYLNTDDLKEIYFFKFNPSRLKLKNKKKRIKNANLEYPIFVIAEKINNQYLKIKIKRVIDGNHRIQNAVDNKVSKIKAYVIDCKDDRITQQYKAIFLNANYCYNSIEVQIEL